MCIHHGKKKNNLTRVKRLGSRGPSVRSFQAVPCGPRQADGFTTHVGAWRVITILSPNNNVIQNCNEKVDRGSCAARLFYVCLFLWSCRNMMVSIGFSKL